jgi:hypothetical protein
MTPALNKAIPEFEAHATGGVKFTPQSYLGKIVIPKTTHPVAPLKPRNSAITIKSLPKPVLWFLVFLVTT